MTKRYIYRERERERERETSTCVVREKQNENEMLYDEKVAGGTTRSHVASLTDKCLTGWLAGFLALLAVKVCSGNRLVGSLLVRRHSLVHAQGW